MLKASLSRLDTKQRRIAAQSLVIAAVLSTGFGVVSFLRSRPDSAPASRPSRPDQHEADLRAAIAADPENPQARQALILHLLSSGRKYDALRAAQEAEIALPKTEALRLTLAETLAATARLPEAIETVRPLTTKIPEARLNLAGYLARTGRRDGATRLLSGTPGRTMEVALRKAQIYLDTLRPELAAESLRPWLNAPGSGVDLPATLGLALLLSHRYSEAVDVLAPAVAAAPQIPTLHFYLGSALRLSGDLNRLSEAEQHLAQAAKLAAGEPLFQYELALVRVQLRDWPGARTAMEEAVILKPDLPEAQRDLARIYERLTPAELDKAAVCRARYLQLLQAPEQAVALLEPIYAADTNNRPIGQALALAYHDAKKSGQAISLLARLHKQFPEDRDVHWDLFRAQRAADENQAALATLDQLAVPNPTSLEVLQARADLLQRLQRHAEAEAVLTQIRAAEPQNAVRAFELGLFQTLWSQQPNRQQLAETNFREALRIQPDYVGPHYRLGLLYESTGQAQQAISHLQRAHELAPELWETLRPLGRAYARLGDRTRADEFFQSYRRFQSLNEEKRRLQLVSTHGGATRETRQRLHRFLLDTNALPEAAHELEAYVYRYPEDSAARLRLAKLHGQARRFQLQFEEESPRGKSGARP